MIVAATYRHVKRMQAAGLRAADVQEIEAGTEVPPDLALFQSWAFSEKAWSLLVPQHGAVAMWGVAPFRSDPTTASPWLLATEEFRNHKRELVRCTKHYIAEMARGYRRLVNYVDVRHTDSLRWLKWAGFTISSYTVPHGPHDMPFHAFYMET